MRRLRPVFLTAVLATAAWLSVASLDWTGPEPGPDRRIDETWLVANVYHGQTAVPRDVPLRLAVGTVDFATEEDAALAIAAVRLVSLPELTPVAFEPIIADDHAELVVAGGLAVDTDYQLDVQPIAQYLWSERFLPAPLWFSTRSMPRLTDVWLNDDTLILSFSEPMAPESLFLGHGSVDLLWSDGAELRSLASDANLADLAWATQGSLFLVGPFAFETPVTLVVSVRVRGLAGGLLDGDEDGEPGTVADDVVQELHPLALDRCQTRSDLPEPCVRPEEIPGGTW